MNTLIGLGGGFTFEEFGFELKDGVDLFEVIGEA